jgi:hypothetical protein
LDAAITCDGEGLGSHAGALLLMRLADRIGLTDGLDARPAARRARRSKHRPGRVLRDIAVVLADGGDCLSDIAVLAQQPGLFGEVASQPTAWNVLEAVADDELGGVDGIRQARADARGRVWQLAGGPPLVDGLLTIDFDATLVTSHSDKVGAPATYKRGYGFHPRCDPRQPDVPAQQPEQVAAWAVVAEPPIKLGFGERVQGPVDRELPEKLLDVVGAVLESEDVGWLDVAGATERHPDGEQRHGGNVIPGDGRGPDAVIGVGLEPAAGEVAVVHVVPQQLRARRRGNVGQEILDQTAHRAPFSTLHTSVLQESNNGTRVGCEHPCPKGP